MEVQVVNGASCDSSFSVVIIVHFVASWRGKRPERQEHRCPTAETDAALPFKVNRAANRSGATQHDAAMYPSLFHLLKLS